MRLGVFVGRALLFVLGAGDAAECRQEIGVRPRATLQKPLQPKLEGYVNKYTNTRA